MTQLFRPDENEELEIVFSNISYFEQSLIGYQSYTETNIGGSTAELS